MELKKSHTLNAKNSKWRINKILIPLLYMGNTQN